MDNKINYITILRAIACIAIVIAHTICTPVIYYSKFYSDFELNISIILSVLFRTGVPIFVMISGALFLTPYKEITFNKILSKYVKRIILAIVVFGTIFALMEIVFNKKDFRLKYIFIALLNTLQNKSWGHMWYLYMITGLYLITPILKVFINNSEQKEKLYVLILLFIFNFIIPFINKIFNISIGVTIPIVGIYVFYYFIGYMINEKILPFNKPIVISSFLTYLLVLIFEALHGSYINIQSVIFDFLSNTALLTSLVPVSIFFIFNYLVKREPNKFEDFVSENSFGIYILHPVFINIIYKIFKLNPNSINILLMWVIVFCISFTLSLFTTFLLRKVPFIRKNLL